jgi:hypothetical protein
MEAPIDSHTKIQAFQLPSAAKSYFIVFIMVTFSAQLHPITNVLQTV